MGKFRDWTHTKGRKYVIAIIFIGAFAIILSYFFNERGGQIGPQRFPVGQATASAAPTPTTDPADIDEDASSENAVLAPQATDQEK